MAPPCWEEQPLVYCWLGGMTISFSGSVVGTDGIGWMNLILRNATA